MSRPLAQVPSANRRDRSGGAVLREVREKHEVERRDEPTWQGSARESGLVPAIPLLVEPRATLIPSPSPKPLPAPLEPETKEPEPDVDGAAQEALFSGGAAAPVPPPSGGAG